MTSQEIRHRFLTFFQEKGHAVLPSASLVPENDPTVLFTTAGMQPLVSYLVGQPHPAGKRLVSVQKCVRTQDIDEVGDNRHDTFFEMLGNWSLGDYFKKEAIAWSWEFLFSQEKGLGLDPARLYVTVFAGDGDAPRDEESIQLWQESFAAAGLTTGLDKPLDQGGRIFSMPKESNWWPAGGAGVGPQGPDTEMHYDLQNDAALTLTDGMPDFESGRLLEIWNDVFMQFYHNEDGTYRPLEKNNVDTGMGLERVAVAVQNAPSIFETDLFAPIMDSLRNTLSSEVKDDIQKVRIIADHLRSSVMLIADGVLPSNKDRGYVLRRLLRRSLLHAQAEPSQWLAAALESVFEIYKEPYPEILGKRQETLKTIEEEANKFHKTLAKGQAEIIKRTSLTGKDAFDLYQSYGFPLELTMEYAMGQGITINEAEFQEQFKLHQELSRTAAAGQFASGLADHSEQTIRYHTATHLLHQALKEVLGDQVQQRGSNITPERLRFDFTQSEKLTLEQVKAVEDKINEQILAVLPITVETMSPEAAKNSGAIGLFGDKYGDQVTVYSIGAYSKEICTGPHVKNTGELGLFRIIKEEAVSAGVRRIKAVLE